MDRRHQIFISSTFSDLTVERGEVIQALLELDCFPAGMELFPATSHGAWELIKGVIDDSDYYCLIIAGRYGSVDEEGLGYTEKEYDYALSTSKPIMVFLHKAPGSIPANLTEKSDTGKQKLEAFRNKVQGAHHCKYWSSPEELGGQVSRSLITLRRSHPAEGWVPGRFAADESMVVENATLRARVSQLEAELAGNKAKVAEAIADFERGEDAYSPHISFMLPGDTDYRFHGISTTWDEILGYVGPTLLGECTTEELRGKLTLCFYHRIQDNPQWEKVINGRVIIPSVVFDEIVIQLRALGYVAPGIKRRAVSDKQVYWRLTEAGDLRLINVQARKRPPQPPVVASPTV